MPTQCNTKPLEFELHRRRRVVADFDGGPITSDVGLLLLRRVDRHLSLSDQVADCFTDHRDPKRIHYSLPTLITQRILGIALGYEDLIDHDPKALQPLLVELFIQAHPQPPDEIILDLDATDDPLHGEQEQRFFHGYYKGYCYLPLYIFSGRHLLSALLRPANIDASADALKHVQRIVSHLRGSWPEVKILLRADSGFAREELMGWCEHHQVDYLFGLARNSRL